MGTLLFSRGIPQRAALDELVLSRPELIGAIHREYLAAGADLIETATFGANRVRLAPYGLADQAGRLARRGAQIAREARDVLWTYHAPELYELLVLERGWSATRYGKFLAHALIDALIKPRD